MGERKQPTPLPSGLVRPPAPPTPPPHERFVRCSVEMVEELRDKPTPPVTLQVTERPDGFLEFVATRHYAYEDLAEQNAALRAMVEEACAGFAECDGAMFGDGSVIYVDRRVAEIRARLAALGEP